MKYKAAVGTLVAGAIAVLLAACGGGGGAEASAGGGDASDGSLTVSGTAAIGTALSGGTITLRCVEGTGSTTTAADGTYRIVVESGAAPCILQATNFPPASAPTVLHSAVFDAPGGKATANVTPLTELGLAQGLGKVPAQVFDTFDEQLAQNLTQTLLTQIRQRMDEALNNAGLGLNGIDPFLSPLQAAHGGVPGDVHDQLLDRLGALVPPPALPVLVNQVVVAAANGGNARVLADAFAGGSLPGCPTAVSGQYRTLDLWGKTVVRDVDFKNMRMRAANGVDWLALTANAGEACSFVATGVVDGRAVETSIVLGAQGAGAYRTHYSDTDSPGVNGYIFPAQAHALAEVDGTWSFLNSGNFPGEGNNHYPGQLKFDAAAGTVAACNYDTDTWACNANPEVGPTVTARADGGFDIATTDPGVVVRMYGYRAPSGTLTLFGSRMLGAYDDPNALLTSIVASRLDTLPLPAVGSVQKYWDVQFTSDDYVITTTAPRADAVTVDSVDSAAGTVTRHRTSDGRQDTLQYNQPLTGTRLRLPGATYAAAIQIPLQGLGMVISANAVPALDTGVMFHVLSVERP